MELIWYLDSGCSRSMTGVKSYLHKYIEQPGPKVVFGDNSSCITEGYGSINYGGIVFIKVAFGNGLKYNLISISQFYDAKYIIQFNDKEGTIFNANKEIILISPRRNNVYVLDMSSLTPNEACFFTKASESINWLWHKRLSHLNFKNISKLSKQNKVLGIPSLVYSKDKPCTACEKGNHHRALFKTKQNFFIRKCFHLLYMDLDPMVENQNDVKDKQTKTNNRIEFRNHKLESFYDEKGISQYFSSLYTPKQNGIAERKNKTLIEAARTMLNGSIVSKNFWTEAVKIACYTQNRSIIIKRHDKTPYEIFKERILDISYFHVFDIPLSQRLSEFITQEEKQIEDTYHVTFDESMEAIKLTNILVNEIGIDDSSRYPPDEFLYKDDPSRQYQSHIPNQAFTSSHPAPQDRWSRDQHIELVNIISNPREGMLIRRMDAKLTAASPSECLFADFLSEIEPKKVFRKKKDGHGTITKNKARLVAQSYSQKEGIYYDETFTPVARIEAIRIFLAFTIYMNFKVYQIDVESTFLNGKLKKEVYVKQSPGFESSEFLDYVCKLDKALYGLKQAPRACSLVKTPMVPPNNFGLDLAGKPVNETSYMGMIRSLMYLIATRLDIQLSIVLCARYQSSPKESHLIAVKRILMYLKGTPTLGACQILGGKLVCWSAKKQQPVAMSSAKAEYVVAAGCCASILWMTSQLSDYDIHYKMVPIFCSNTSAIAISNNPVLHSRTKHNDIRYHFIRDHILNGDTELHFIPTEYQLADIFTKPLDEPTFTRLKAELGMLNID
nr:retrovirus-related Pol polyprotein from transposon TNT 1-94 [Tanacetum cinerariifolium]